EVGATLGLLRSLLLLLSTPGITHKHELKLPKWLIQCAGGPVVTCVEAMLTMLAWPFPDAFGDLDGYRGSVAGAAHRHATEPPTIALAPAGAASPRTTR